MLKAIKISGIGDGRMPASLYSGRRAQAIAKYVASAAGTKWRRTLDAGFPATK